MSTDNYICSPLILLPLLLTIDLPKSFTYVKSLPDYFVDNSACLCPAKEFRGCNACQHNFFDNNACSYRTCSRSCQACEPMSSCEKCLRSCKACEPMLSCKNCSRSCKTYEPILSFKKCSRSCKACEPMLCCEKMLT